MSTAVAAKGPEGEPDSKKGKSKKLIIAAAAIFALGGGGGAYYFLKPKPVTDDAKSGDAHAVKAAPKQLVYLPMETFTVNLRDADKEHFLQVIISLEVADTSIVESIKQQMPSMRNRVLMLLSSKGSEDILPREGKELLAAEIAAELRKTLGGAGPNKGLEQVLFTHFVIQ
jgi:flagellar protein FliL